MKVDKYKVNDERISEVIEKLTAADVSLGNKEEYLKTAMNMIVELLCEISLEEGYNQCSEDENT